MEAVVPNISERSLRSMEPMLVSFHDNRLLIAYILFGVLVLVLGLCYVATFLDSESLFLDVAKWPRFILVIALVASMCTDVSLQFELLGNLPSLWRETVFCQGLMLLHWLLDGWVYVSLVLASLERLISLWMGEPDNPGFDKPATIGIMCGGLVISAVWSAASLYADGTGPTLLSHGDTQVCAIPFHQFGIVLDITRLIEWLVLLALAMLLTGRLLKSRLYDTKPYPRAQIVPITVADLIMVIALLLNDKLFTYSLDIAAARVLIILVLLLGDPEIRRPYCSMCCPCCPQEEPSDEKMRLISVRFYADTPEK